MLHLIGFEVLAILTVIYGTVVKIFLFSVSCIIRLIPILYKIAKWILKHVWLAVSMIYKGSKWCAPIIWSGVCIIASKLKNMYLDIHGNREVEIDCIEIPVKKTNRYTSSENTKLDPDLEVEA